MNGPMCERMSEQASCPALHAGSAAAAAAFAAAALHGLLCLPQSRMCMHTFLETTAGIVHAGRVLLSREPHKELPG